jgi:hypothetical protein
MLPRLDEIEDDLQARRSRAAHEGWLGEVEGLDVTLAFLRQKREESRRLSRIAPVDLGIPGIPAQRACGRDGWSGARRSAPTTRLPLSTVVQSGGDAATTVRSVLDEQLLDQMVTQMRSDGVRLSGPGGFLTEMVKAVLERGLAAELTEHLGYEKHDPVGHGSGNSRNGTTPKTVLTEVGRWRWTNRGTGRAHSPRPLSRRGLPSIEVPR